jgi:hypothetical protein
MGKDRYNANIAQIRENWDRRYGCTSEHRIHRGVFPLAETEVSIRIDLESEGRIGAGKIALLEAIRETGSIAAAAYSMKMFYSPAWLLVDELNKLLNEPVVATTAGGAMGRHKTYAGRRKDHRTLPLDRGPDSISRAQRIQALRKLIPQLSGGWWLFFLASADSSSPRHSSSNPRGHVRRVGSRRGASKSNTSRCLCCFAGL